MNLEQQLEALLFFKGEPTNVNELAKLSAHSSDDVFKALQRLAESLQTRGICLILKDEEALLATTPEVSSLIESARKEELSRDIGKAGLETLSIVLYRAPVARSEIDYIRGVNSTFILRNLLIRGLIERIQNPKDQRSFLYRPTVALLSVLGISTMEELPGFRSVSDELTTYVANQTNENDGKE
jgi:segregation and condensation protein B